MKSFLRKMTKPLYVSFLLLFLASCNFSNDLPAVNPLPVITDLPVKLTASFDIDSSTPNSLQNLVLQASENKTEASRSATASMPSHIQYFVTAETLGEAVPLTVNVPDDDIDEANKRFTINLRTGHNWRITVGIRDTDINETILSDYTDKELTATNTDISHNFTLKPAITSGKNGSVYLEIKLADSAYAIDITDADNAYTDWNTNLTTSGTTRTLDIASIPSGRYVLKIKFTKANTIPFTATQTVTVYDNLKTNTWVSGGNALIDPSTHEFLLSSAIIAAANEGKKIYYVDGRSGGSGDNNNSGNINSPLLTVARAVSLINAVGNTSDTYKIYVKDGSAENLNTLGQITIGDTSVSRKVEIETYQFTPGDKLGTATLTQTAPISAIVINDGSELTISGNLVIDGNTLNCNGVLNSGNFCMNGGFIKNCYQNGVDNQGVFRFYGGYIINNRGSGISVSTSARLYVKGYVNVYNNSKSDGITPSNVYLPNGKLIFVTDSLDSLSRICVTTETDPTLSPVIITDGFSTYNSTITAGSIFKGDVYGIKQVSGEAYVAASGGALTQKYSDDVQITIEGPSTVWTGTGATATVTVTKNGTAVTSPTLTLQSFSSAGSSYNSDDYRTFTGNTLTLPDSLVEGKYTATVSTTIEGVKYSGAKTFNVVPKEVTVSSGDFNTTTNLSQVFKSGRTTVANIRPLIASTHEVTQKEYEMYCKYGSSQKPDTTAGLSDANH